ncbi:MAG: hypothetical protein LBU73_01085 [Helicobacteraceae bacterium]|nr:hypothetical protein [Helicobacteraceae bacterium]
MPEDADANGAYHIALKGLWLLRKLKENTDPKKAIESFNKLKKAQEDKESKKMVSQWCNNIDWLNFAQKRNKRNK